MAGVFFGVLRSGTRRELLEQFGEFIDRELDPEPVVTPPRPPPPPVSAPPRDSSRTIGDVRLTLRDGVPIRATQVSNPNRYAIVPERFWRALEATWPREHWLPATALAFLESDYREDAHNPSSLEDSWGALQVNRKAWPSYSVAVLSTYLGNLRAARSIYEIQGWRAWLNSARRLGLVA